MRIGLLGPVAAWADGGDGRVPAADLPRGQTADDLAPKGLRARGLLTRLALDPGRTVTTTTLVDALWGELPPDGAANALQALVSRLRRALGPERITTVSGGYRLEVAPAEVDALRFAELLGASRAQPEPAAAAELVAAGLALWRGPALADVQALPFAAAEAGVLAEQRANAIEWSASLALRLGRPESACEELAALLAEQPLRESAAAALAHCLAVAGRQADALRVLDRTRERLAEELGVDPGTRLKAARLAVLRGELAPSARNARPGPAALAPVPTAGPAAAVARDAPVTAAAARDSTSVDQGMPAERRPAAARRVAHRGTIPVALTSFVGRDADMTRVHALLACERLVTLVGPGGAGKTRLAQEALASWTSTGRAMIAELAPLTVPDELPATVLAAVGGPEIVLRAEDVEQDVWRRLVGTIGDAPLVLLLDNCEHLVGAAAELAAYLLARCPGLRVLATSREPLGVTGERLYPVEALDDVAAVRLFVDRGRAVVPGFAPDGAAEAVIAEICRRLDGQPLPIELAAARLRMLSPAEIRTRLDDRFRLLTSGSRTLPRHQTLRAVVDWSWELLSEPERAVARRLAVFAGGATAEAAELVCADPGGYDVFDLLATLVDKSLVVAVPGEPTRYRMLETIREYAGERLAGSGERETVEAAHACWAVALVEQAEPELRGPDQLSWLDRVQAEIDNVTSALRRALARRRAELAARLAVGTFWFWQLRGLLLEATTWIEAVGGLVADLSGGQEEALVPVLHARLAAYQAFVAAVVGDFDRARPLAGQAAALAAAADPAAARHPATALAGPLLAAFTGDEGPLAATSTDHPDAWTRATALTVRAVLAENDGRIDDQRRLTRSAHALFRRTGDRFGIGNSLAGLGELERLSGGVGAAAAAYEEAIGLARELGSTDDLPQFLMRRAQLAAQQGAAREADEWFAQARDAVDPTAGPAVEVMLAMTEAELRRRRGDGDGARRILAGLDPAAIDSLSIDQRRAHVWLQRALVELDQGEPGQARALLAAAAGFALASRDGPVVAVVAEAAARWALTGGDGHTAARLLGVATAQRGTLDHGDPEVVAVIDAVRAAGGEQLLAEAAGLPRQAGEELLRAALGTPLRSGDGTAPPRSAPRPA